VSGVRVLVLWMPDWPVTGLGFRVEEPVVVLHAGRVAATSQAARAGGVRAGLRRREAEARCPDLIVARRDPVAEARAFEPVVRAVTELVPLVEVTGPGLLSFDARGPTRYYRGEKRLAKLILAATESVLPPGTPPARVGIADGRFAATVAARAAAIVPPGEAESFLAPLPVSVLGDNSLADLLGRLGIDTVGGFAGLPRAKIAGRFDPSVQRLHDLANGIDAERLTPVSLEREVAVTVELDPPAEQAEMVAFAARPLAEELLDRLAARGQGAARVRVQLETEHGESSVRCWRGGEDALSVEEVVERTRWQVDGWLSGPIDRPSAGVSLLRFVADQVVPASGRQLALWGGRTDSDRRALRGLDRLSAMLGPDAVLTPALTGGRSPADRVVLVPWGEPAPASTVSLPWPGRHPSPAPALVHPVPLPAVVVDAEGRPVTVSGRGAVSAAPARLSIGSQRQVAVAGWAGPWTVDERHWAPAERRRYARFQVVTAAQTAYLMVVQDGQWSVEATYD
jgi:protein ImuB